jgi:hypothetical protein
MNIDTFVPARKRFRPQHWQCYYLLSSLFGVIVSLATGLAADLPENRLRLLDLFDLEFASEPQIAPDGSRVIFVRNCSDIMKDQRRSTLWSVAYDGSDLRPVTAGIDNIFSPRWSRDGKQLLYAARRDGSVQIYVQ